MARRASGEEWRETRRAVVEALRSGRVTIQEVSDELGVSRSAIGGWIAAERQRREREGRPVGTPFVRVDVPGSGRGGADVAVLVLRGGRRLRVSEGFAAEELARLVRTLESLC
jgi:hypothetical protein